MNITGFHKGQAIVDSIPDGWKVDKQCGTLPGYVYIYDEFDNRTLAPCPGYEDPAKPVVHEWFIEFVVASRMNSYEYTVLNVILSQVLVFNNDSNTWSHSGYCCLSNQSFVAAWGMSLATARSAIKCLELAGIITVQARAGAPNRITLTPHTNWVVNDFRKLRAIAKGK